MHARDEHRWWQRGIIYQIYPRSFQDSDGDGVGDLAGILRRLDHLVELGVDAVWISPFYPSPMADFGYDVADYTGIDPLFGTMDHFDRLRESIHRRGMKVILDFVPNHTSSEHPWFLASRSSRDDPKRSWYLWRDPAPDGGPPNNWLSVFGGSAWELDERTGQYYYHAFLKGQPDLDWRNPEVERAMFDAMRFWLDRGVDGFRVDVMWHMIKDRKWRDNPLSPDHDPVRDGEYRRLMPVYSTDQPEVHDIVARMRRLLDGYGDRLLIGEIYLPFHDLVAYYGEDLSGAHLPFNFELLNLPWDARHIDAAINEYEAVLPEGAWPNWVLGNHDKSRIATRVGRAQARVAAMLLLTLRGTPTLYYGDEIGMCDVSIPPDRVQDPQEKNEPGLGLGRDPQRTPMQWDGGEHAGFTTGPPWLPLAADHREVNVAVQRDDPHSMLSLYRRLIGLRRAEPALSVGGFRPHEPAGDALAWLRTLDGTPRFLVALNLTGDATEVAIGHHRGHVALSTHLDRESEPVRDVLRLRPDEGAVLRLDEP